MESVETELRLLGADAESTIFAAVVADDLETTRDLHQQLAQLDSVAAVRSIAEIIPSEQDAKQHLIARIRESIGTVQFNVPSVAPPDADDLLRSLVKLRVRAQGLARAAAEEADETGQRVWEELVSVLRTTGDALRVLPVDVREAHLAASTDRFFTDLEDHLNLIAGQAARPMKLEDVPQDIRRMLVGRTGRYLIRVFPRENIWEREPLMTFVDEVRSVAPKATGTPLGLYEFVEILLQGYRNAALWGVAGDYSVDPGRFAERDWHHPHGFAIVGRDGVDAGCHGIASTAI